MSESHESQPSIPRGFRRKSFFTCVGLAQSSYSRVMGEHSSLTFDFFCTQMTNTMENYHQNIAPKWWNEKRESNLLVLRLTKKHVPELASSELSQIERFQMLPPLTLHDLQPGHARHKSRVKTGNFHHQQLPSHTALRQIVLPLCHAQPLLEQNATPIGALLKPWPQA